MNDIDVSVIKYLGKVDNGIIVLIAITIPSEDISFDATFFYTDTKMILTVSEEVEEIIGDIKETPEYPQILKLCLRKVIPHNELIDSIDPLDVKPYLKAIFPDKNFDE
jgi:hypothetical protein